MNNREDGNVTAGSLQAIEQARMPTWSEGSRRRRFAETWRRFRRSRTAVAGLIVILVIIGAALFADVVAPHDPYQTAPRNILQPPSREHLMGTDAIGRDLFSRIIFGSRVSLQVGIISIGIAAIAGVTLGIIAAYYGKLVDSLIMRFLDALLAFPAILLAIFVMAVLGPSIRNAMIAIGVIFVPAFARLTRANALSLKEKEFVLAARAVGARDVHIMLRTILPNCLSPLIVQASLGIAYAVLVEAGLSFLGLGVQPPDPSWGSILSAGRGIMTTAPWVATFPGIAIFLCVLGFNLAGDGIREALDPHLKNM
jgi:peptide/nickel transport system permease protein